MTLSEMSEGAKHSVDALSLGAIVASFFSWLPQISAFLAALWFLMRIAIGWQEFRMNNRKMKAQDASLKSYRQHLESTLKEGIPPDLKRLLDQLK